MALVVSRLIKSNSLLNNNVNRCLMNSDSRPPLLYGVPKVHNENMPIVSSIGSLTYNLAKFLSKQLGECVGRTESFVKDSRHFISLTKNLQLQETDMLVSFDVESLFTKMPIPDTVNIINDILNKDLAELCLRYTIFLYLRKVL